jgi:hypothetical protein
MISERRKGFTCRIVAAMPPIPGIPLAGGARRKELFAVGGRFQENREHQTVRPFISEQN